MTEQKDENLVLHARFIESKNHCFGEILQINKNSIPFDENYRNIMLLMQNEAHAFLKPFTEIQKELNDLLAESKEIAESTYEVPDFAELWHKLQDYKQSQESKPKFEVEWKDVFPLELLPDDNITPHDWLMIERGIHIANTELKGFKIHEVKVWSV